MDRIYTTYYKSPIGYIQIKGNMNGIVSLDFIDEEEDFNIAENHECMGECIKQLDEYFKGTRQIFNLNLLIEGTDFRKKIWRKLIEIPYGETRSYLDIAKAIGNKNSVRAVGGANHNNRISIIIPCHRVIGSSGNLVGYGGGLWRKQWLLEHEGKFKGF